MPAVQQSRPGGIPGGCAPCAVGVAPVASQMIRWLIVIFLALLLVNGLSRWLERLGLGRLPGDFRFKLFGREVFLPIASTVLLSMVAALIAKLV